MIKKQITKKQHYVPKFYLRKFANANGKVEVLDCKRRSIGKPKSPKGVCYEKYFYSIEGELDEVSQKIETEFQSFEDEISNNYDVIASKFFNFEQITEDDKMFVATFMALQYLRGPYVRAQIKELDETIYKQFISQMFSFSHIHKSFDEQEKETGKKITNEQRQKIIEFAKSGKYTIKTGNTSHLRVLGEMEDFRNLLFGKEWRVYISKSSKKFITSDNPVVEIFPEWTKKIFYGATFLQRTHLFAMTPEVLIVATEPRNLAQSGKVKRKTLFDNKEDNKIIFSLNSAYPQNALAYAYANDRSFLQDMIDGANLHNRQQVEKLEQMIRNIIR